MSSSTWTPRTGGRCAPSSAVSFLRPDEFKFTDEELQQYDAQALTDLLQERASDIYARKEAELGEPSCASWSG